jgi:hypothetical protein
MATIQDPFDELLSSVMIARSKTFVDNATLDYPLFTLLSKMFSKGDSVGWNQQVVVDKVAEPAESDDTSGTFAVTQDTEILKSALYVWPDTPIVGTVRLADKIIRQNSGKNRIVNLATIHATSLEERFRELFVNRAYLADGSRTAGTMLSLDSLFNSNITDVGGLDSGTYSLWDSTYVDATDMSPLEAMDALFDGIAEAAHKQPKKVLSGKTLWNGFRDQARSDGVLEEVGGRTADYGWKSYAYDGVEIMRDFDCPDDEAYGITPSTLILQYLGKALIQRHDAQTPIDTAGYGNLDKVYPYSMFPLLGTNERRLNGKIENYGVSS